MSSYRIKVVEYIIREYEIGGCDTEDQAMKIAEEECADGDATHQVDGPEYEYTSEVVE